MSWCLCAGISWPLGASLVKTPNWPWVSSPESSTVNRSVNSSACSPSPRLRKKASGDETQGQFGVFTSDAPRGQLIPAHKHHDTHETFYIVEGKVRVYIEDRDGTKRSQLLEPGDFGFVPSGLAHAYQVQESARILGTATGGFERFFQQMGTPVDRPSPDQPPFIPDFPRMQAAAQQHNMQLMQGFEWPDA